MYVWHMSRNKLYVHINTSYMHEFNTVYICKYEYIILYIHGYKQIYMCIDVCN